MKDTAEKKNPEFQVQNCQKKIKVNPDRIRTCLEGCSGLFQSPPSAIGVILVSRKEIRKLNRQFLKKDADTDVMSFKISRDYGEIVISPETAAENAGIYGLTAENEILYLIVHGYLHLKNYRDYTESEKEMMFEKQDAMFKKMLETSKGIRR
jgi:rRNA maturation RNase YbeY